MELQKKAGTPHFKLKLLFFYTSKMKFIILASLAASISFSIAEGSEYLKTMTRDKLQFYFNVLEPEIINCGTDFETLHPKLNSRLNRLSAMFDALNKEADNHYEDTDKRHFHYFNTRCRTSKSINQIKKDIIQTALPCVRNKDLAEKLEYSKVHDCDYGS